MASLLSDLHAKVASVRRTPSGPAAGSTSLNLEAVYGYLVKNQETQKGEEGIRVDGVTPELLTGLTFFANRLCPYANRAYWALQEKGLLKDGSVKYVHVELFGNKPAWYKDVYYKGTLPAFVEDGTVIGESAVVLEFIEERFPSSGPSLFPSSPLQRAAVRFLIKIFDGGVPNLYGLLGNKDPSLDAAKLDLAVKFLGEINDLYVKQSPAGPYFLGEELSAADIAIVPFLARFDATLPFYRGVDALMAGGEKTARLRRLLDTVRSRPGFISTQPPPEFYVAVYFDKAGGVL